MLEQNRWAYIDRFYMRNVFPTVKHVRGTTRLHVEMLKRAMPRLQREKNGYVLDHGGKSVWAEKFTQFSPTVTEYEFFQAWMDCIDPGDIAVDIGAHNATYALFAASVASTVYAFEMDKYNAEGARELIKKNPYNNIQLEEKAVAAENGSINAAVGANGESRIGVGNESVDTVSLDAFFAERSDPDIIKMDIEGAEIQALRGANAVLRRSQPILLIEVHEGYTNFKHTTGDVRNHLNKYGYDVDVLMTDTNEKRIMASPPR